MNKGERTRQTILEQGLKYISRYGLADITIGNIAKQCGLSRTGVISHFKNKEDMQIAILEFAEQTFIDCVIVPVRHEDALVHIRQLLDTWADWTRDVYSEGNLSCPFVRAVVDFQNREDSEVRRFVLAQQTRLLTYIARRVTRCIEQGLFVDTVPADVIAYEMYSLYFGHSFAKTTAFIVNIDEQFKSSISRLLIQYQAH